MALGIRPRIRRAFRLALRRRDLTDVEIEEELRFHIEMRVAQLMLRGVSRDDAAAAARRRFGESWDDAVTRLHEAGHLREERLRVRERLDAWWHDLVYITRTLARQRGFALVVIATFALGIGANATMFGVIDRLLLRPPPHIAAPSEVMKLGFVQHYQGVEGFGGGLSYPFSAALRADTVDFSGVTVSESGRYTLGSGADAEQVFGTLVSGDYFTILGTRPALGRFFLPGEDRESGGESVVVLSHAFWQRRFGENRRALGQTLHIGPSHFIVVGVAPPGFTGPDPTRVDFWIPIGSAEGLRSAGPDWATTWDNMWLGMYVRLRPGVRADAATARVRELYKASRAAWQVSKGRPPSRETVPLDMRSILPAQQLRGSPEARVSRLLVVVTGVVLLIACANVANLLLARGTQRRREIAVRLALGVSRARLLWLLLAETMVLALVGGAIAMGVAVAGVRVTHAMLLQDFEWVQPGIDGRAIGMTLLLVAVTILVAGLVPALRASAPNVTETLKTGGREGSVRQSRTRTGLLIVQAALSVLLLIEAGLFVRSLREVASLRLGYEPDRVVAATMDLRPLGYKDADRIALFTAIRNRVAVLPGVEHATIAATHPLSGRAFATSFSIPGRDSLPASPIGGPYFNRVGGDYFSTLGLRIVDGRPITAADAATRSHVAVVNESLARAYWPNERAVGRCMILDNDSTCSTIAGVTADAREQVRQGPERFMIYTSMGATYDAGTTFLLARSRASDARSLIGPIRNVMQTAAPNLPYADVQTFEGLLAPQLRPWRMGAILFTLFGVLALLIAAGGLYSAISYGVAQRRHEFGVRMALGAQIADVVRLVMGQGIRAAAVGVAVGSVAALVMGRFVAGLLFGTSPRDPRVFAIVAVIILIAAVAATVIPAWRASRIDPITALRAD